MISKISYSDAYYDEEPETVLLVACDVVRRKDLCGAIARCFPVLAVESFDSAIKIASGVGASMACVDHQSYIADDVNPVRDEFCEILAKLGMPLVKVDLERIDIHQQTRKEFRIWSDSGVCRGTAEELCRRIGAACVKNIRSAEQAAQSV